MVGVEFYLFLFFSGSFFHRFFICFLLILFLAASGGFRMSTSLINNKYRVTKRIGGGSFGEIYMGVTATGEKVQFMFYFISIPLLFF